MTAFLSHPPRLLTWTSGFFLLYAAFQATFAAAAEQAPCPSTLDYDVRPLATNEMVNLCQRYRGKVLLIVNTASKCAYTPQYEGLEAMYEKYAGRGLVVLGFPSNDFAEQDPGSEKQIQKFCRLTYGVQFPMFEKTRVLQRNASPLYRTLGELAGEYPRWNFHKYLIDRRGRLVGSFGSHVTPENTELVDAIESLL